MKTTHKFAVLSTSIKKVERSHTCKITAHLKDLEKGKIIPKGSRWQEIIKPTTNKYFQECSRMQTFLRKIRSLLYANDK